VAVLFLILTRFKLLYIDWRGYLMALFALVWVANLHISIYNRIRLDIKHERIEIKTKEEEVDFLAFRFFAARSRRPDSRAGCDRPDCFHFRSPGPPQSLSQAAPA